MLDSPDDPFLFPPGITRAGEPHDSTKAIVSWAHEIARSADLQVSTYVTPEVACSFSALSLRSRFGEETWLLYNRFVPVVGFAAQEPTLGDAFAVASDFVDSQGSSHQPSAQFTVLPAAILNSPVLPDYWASSEPWELKQARYFKPEKVAQVIFNFWD